MNFCAVYANANDEELKMKYYTDLYIIFLFLLVDKDVRFIILDPSKRFDRLCEEVIEDTKDFRINDIRVLKAKKMIPHEELFRYRKYRDKDLPIWDYLICDESTKESAIEFFKPTYIIEMPKSKLCILADAPL